MRGSLEAGAVPPPDLGGTGSAGSGIPETRFPHGASCYQGFSFLRTGSGFLSVAGVAITNYLLAGFCLYFASLAALSFPREGGSALILGQRAGIAVRVATLGWGAAGLIFHWPWPILAAALLLALPLRRRARESATGFAEGRKTAQLACADEYVRGRVQPVAGDWGAGITIVAVLRGAPLVYLVAAAVEMWR